MQKLVFLDCIAENTEKNFEKLIQNLNQGRWVILCTKYSEKPNIPDELLPKEPGVIITSGGSTGGPKLCLHPYENLNKSALATGNWLSSQGVDPNKCAIYNPLPLNHVSGLMPWWRSKCWKINHHWIHPKLIKNPEALQSSHNLKKKNNENYLLLSLVPTQLNKLIKSSIGRNWLKQFDVIWLGGSSVSMELLILSRKHQLNLSLCYGTTETMAMISALPPKKFLAGDFNSGNPLMDVDIRLDKENLLEIKTSRTAKFIWTGQKMITVKDNEGWWKSGDYATIFQEGKNLSIFINGRVDNAINSGGETIFPDQVQEKLLKIAFQYQLPIKRLLLIPINDSHWGERLIALFLLDKKAHYEKEYLLEKIKLISNRLPAPERPLSWYKCDPLSKNYLGKWDIKKWTLWAERNSPII